MDLKTLEQIQNEVMAEAQKLCGTLWKEVYSEIHGQYKQIPIWILFFEDTDLSQAHKAFRDLVSPFIPRIGEYQFTVSYECYRDEDLVMYDFLESNTEILRGWSVSPPLGASPSSTRKKSPLFQSQDSKRP